MTTTSRTRRIYAALGGIALILSLACGAGDEGGRPVGGASDGASAGQPAQEPDEPDRKYVAPKPADLALSIKILQKECFGSAGCNVRFRVVVTYNGDPATLDPATTWEVTYEVTGGEDPLINTFTMTGDRAEISEELVSTRSRAAKLRAKVTSVEKLY